MTTTTITVELRNGTTKSVETPYTDDQVLVRLDDLCFNGTRPLFRNQFATDLARKARLSDKQIAWVHILVVEHETPRALGGLENLLSIRDMMDQAHERGVAMPKIVLATDSGGKVKISRAGSSSRAPGTIWITDGKPFGQNTLYGSIDLNGRFTVRDDEEEIMSLLKSFNADPASTATAHGHATGNCCFCRKRLTDVRSVAMGYGPICAENFSLPWGEERAATSVEVSAIPAIKENSNE